MSESIQYPRAGESLPQYLEEVEPLVATVAPGVGDDRVFLGWLHELLPSRTRSAQHLTEADWAWLAALGQVVHRHQLSYELLTHTGAVDALWLIPAH